jgi:hypothetical protein
MSAAPASRKVAVEITLDGEVRSATAVGSRTVYHYWNFLVSHYRGVLLPPQRRTDGQSVAWTWAQAADASAPGADELRALRRRLSEAHRHFVDAVSEGLTGAPISTEDAEELRARMGRIVAHLVSLPEREVLGYVGSTLQGWQFHSWGAPAPGTESYPDDQVLSVRGRVRQGDAGVSGAEVSLEDSDGRTVDETRSDSGGLYAFYKLKPGSYRVKASSNRVKFAPEGIPVELRDAPVGDADVVAEDPAEKVDVGEPVGSRAPVQAAADGSAENTGSGARRWVLGVLVLLLLAGGSVWYFFLREGDSKAAPQTHSGARGSEGAAQTVRANPGNAREVSADAPIKAGGGGVGRDSTWSNSERKRTTQGRLSGAQLEEFDSSKRGRAGASTGGAPLRPQTPGTEGGLPGDPEGEPQDDALAPDAGGRAPTPSPAPKGTVTRKPHEGTKAANGRPGQSQQVSPPNNVSAADSEPNQTPGTDAAKKTGAMNSKPKPKPGTPPRTGAQAGQPGQAEGGNTAAAPGATPFTTVDGDDETAPAKDTATDQESSAGRGPKVTAKRGSGRAANATDAAATPEQEQTPEPQEETATASESPAVALPPGEERWLATLLVSTRRWAPRFTEDRILPTEPTREGADDGASRIHAAEWARVRQRLPEGFTAAKVRGGVRFIVRDPAARLPLSWEVARGLTGAESSTSGARAEIAWSGGAPLASAGWDLRDARGAIWARVRTTAAGEFSAARREGVTFYLWAEVDWHPDPGAREPHWRVDTDARLPDGWTPVDGVKPRLEAPVEAVSEAPRPRIEYLDTNSGWALASEWLVRPARESAVNP